MLAANLSVAMAQALNAKSNPHSIVLVDLNLQFGDIDLLLNLNPDNTIAGLSQKGHTGIDAELVEQYLTVHEETGLRILVAPSAPRYAESITAYTIEQVIDALRESYQYVVIDTTSQLQDVTLAALDAANIILLLTSLDLLALHKTRTAMEMLRQLYTGDKIQPVLNRANSDVGISPQDVEEVLGMPVQTLIPSDGRNVVKSVNDGVPVVLSMPEAQISKRVQTLALQLIGREAGVVGGNAAADRKGGFFGRLFGS
jgi:pilus assembly protein CpaE